MAASIFLAIGRRRRLPATPLCLAVALGCCAASSAQSSLPDAPTPNPSLIADAALPVPQLETTFPPQSSRHKPPQLPSLRPNYIPLPRPCRALECSQTRTRTFCCQSHPDLFQQYLRQDAIHIYTPRELGHLAVSSVIDPFNLLTIAGTSAYSVAIDSHSPYGPGVMGWARYSGVALGQDATGAFFGTFLIPSIDHQDPHYLRLPNASLIRRIAHCIYQPFWIDSDTGQGMINYSTIVGGVAEEAVGDAYVPYRQVGFTASAQRVAVSWATAPVGNFITEFVPDIARHINFNIVFVQRIINQVATEEGGGALSSPPPP